MKKPFKHKKLLIGIALLILLALLIYFYTYFFTKEHDKVIYQDAQRRIYLTDKKGYKAGREMWRMVYEEVKSGDRWFVLGNSKKGFKNKDMAKIVLNTFDQGKSRSFDNVAGAGCTFKQAKTDIHSNMNEKKGADDFDFDKEFDFAA